MKLILLYITITLCTAIPASAFTMDTTDAIIQTVTINNDDEFTLLSNPVKNGILLIKINNNKTTHIQLSIINSIGEQVYYTNKSVGQNTISFDISNVASGIYFLRLQGNNHNIVKKLIVQ